MSYRKKLQDITEQKRMLVAKADLQRSTFTLTTRLVFNLFRAAEAGFLAIKTGKAIARQMKH